MSALGGAVLTATLAAVGSPPLERGVALGLFSADERFDYAPLVDEIAGLGATHISVAYVLWQTDQASADIHAVDTWTPTEGQILDTLRAARRQGLHTTLFPILRLIRQEPGQWRGTIAPADEDAWWASYGAAMLRAAELAQAGGAARLAIGSELVSRESMRARWLELIDRVRVAAPALSLLYSANWDHHRPVRFWDAVDVVGVTAYFELTRDSAAGTSALIEAWRPVLADLAAWSRELGRPIVITEIGYPSLDGGAVWPWDQSRQAPVDLEEQRRAYAAFVSAWSDRPFLEGVFFWNWFGEGGPRSTDYTPRRKPAEAVLRGWFAAPRFPGAPRSRTKGQ